MYIFNKVDFLDNDLVYWLFSSNVVVDFIFKVGEWDLFFICYFILLDDNEGSIFNYLFIGIFFGFGVEVV